MSWWLQKDERGRKSRDLEITQTMYFLNIWNHQQSSGYLAQLYDTLCSAHVTSKLNEELLEKQVFINIENDSMHCSKLLCVTEQECSPEVIGN